MPVVRSVRVESVALIEPLAPGLVLDVAVPLEVPGVPVAVLLPDVPVPLVSVVLLVPVPDDVPVPDEVPVADVSLLVLEPAPVAGLLGLVVFVVVEPVLLVVVVTFGSLPLPLVPVPSLVCAATGNVQAAATAITRTLCLKLFMLTPS